jgi:hypothetical protein
MKPIEIGKLLRASISGFVVGCRLSQMETPSLGALVRVKLEPDYQIYGLITEIHIEDDGLVRQLATSEGISPEVIADNRENRNVPVEISVLAVGYRQGGKVSHLLPPRPALSLDTIYLCTDDEVIEFTADNRFGYFRHILRAQEMPVAEIVAAHLRQVQVIQYQRGNSSWLETASRELITLMRDDYPTLMNVLGALADLDIVQ